MIFRALLITLALVLSLSLKGKGFTFSKSAKRRMMEKRKATLERKKRTPSPFDDDEDFGEGLDDDGPKSREELEQERYEAKLTRDMEKADRSRVHAAVMEAGGLKTRDDLREEYSEIPNTYKRRDGLPGDEMADYFATYFPEYGITNERDLIDYLAS